MQDPESRPADDAEDTLPAGKSAEGKGRAPEVEPDRTIQEEIEPTIMSGIEPTIGHEGFTAGTRTESTQVVGADLPTVTLQAGARVGSYRLVRMIGKGAQGSVWHAFNEVAERDFALKFINSELLRAKWATASIRSEANVLFDLTHSAIVRLNNIEQVGKHLFLVMELLGGPSLSGFLKDRRRERGVDPPAIDVDECLWILERLAPALDYAAAEGITHRDIKPGNLMLTEPVDQATSLTECDADVKLCDFGIAFVEQEVRPGEKISPTGTPPYMAPEVIEGEVPTWRADVYSLAATLYALYVGEPPLRGSTLVEILQKVKNQEVPPLATGDKAFDAAIARGLSVDPLERQESFDEFLFEASDGKMGKRAASRARSYRLLAAATTLLAVGAVAYALDPFGLRRGQAEFVLDETLGQRDGATVVTRAEFPLRFDYRSPGDETVGVAVDGGSPVTVLPLESGSDRYELNIDLDGDGVHEVEVLTEDGATVLGQTSLYLDMKVELPAEPIRLVKEPPVDTSELIEVTFEVGEDDVEVIDVNVVPAQLLALEFSERRASHGLTVDAQESADVWTVTRTFQFRDRYGNEAERSITFEVYDGAEIVDRLRHRFPGGTDGLHLWDLPDHAAAVEEWRAEVLAAPIPDADETALLAEFRARIEAVRALSADPPERTLSLALDGGTWLWTRESDGSDTVYTRAADLTLQGATTESRSDEIDGIVSGVGLKIEGSPVVDRGTGGFAVTVSLEDEADGRLRLSLPNGGPVASVRLVRDDVGPEATRTSPAERAVLRAQQVDVAFEITDGRSGVESVILVGPDGSEAEMMRDDRDGLWRRTAPLTLEGENLFRIRSTDKAGNATQEDFAVVRDTTAPTVAREILPSTSVKTGSPTRLQWQFDEEIARASARVELIDDQGVLSVEELDPPEPEGASVDISVALPFRPLSRMTVELTVEDAVGNEAKFTAGSAVTHDPWGAVPASIRDNAELILDPTELESLVGAELASEVYVADGAKWFPRCIRNRKSGLEFVYVESGSFEYGPPGAGKEVSMRGFYVARTEVSGRQFIAGTEIDEDRYPRDDFEDSDLPIRARRNDAGTWCARMGFVLPTEAQWEYAASGPNDRIYPWGNEPNTKLRNGPSNRQTDPKPPLGPVDAFPGGRSWCGALQMSGNLAEMCRDALKPGEGVASEDPAGPSTSDESGYVIRGGSNNTAQRETEKTHGRHRGRPNDFQARNGFRPVWPLTGRR